MSKKKKNRKGRKAKDREERDYQTPASSAPSSSIPLLPQEDMASRFIQLLERQMQAKDEQIRMLDARLQDAFDMQRALALIVRESEQRTGISSDVVWDQVPEEDLTREHHPKQEAAKASIIKDHDAQDSPAVPESQVVPDSPAVPESPAVPNEPDAQEPPNQTVPRTFEDWLGHLG